MADLLQPVLIPCPVLKVGARGYEISLPGGATISVQSADMYTTDPEICRQLLGQLQGYMAPMAPLFTMVQGVLCLKDIVTAIPESIIELDPTKVTDVLERCAPTLEKLLSLIPAVSAPLMICSVLDVLICVLNGAITEVELVVLKQTQADALQAKVKGPNDPLFAILECQARLNGNRMCAINESLGPLNTIIELLNLFMQMIGADALPSMSDVGSDATAMLQTLRAFITPLKIAKNALGCGLVSAVPRC